MRRYRLFWDSAVKTQKHVHCSIAVAYEYVLKNNLACGGATKELKAWVTGCRHSHGIGQGHRDRTMDMGIGLD